MKVIVLRGQYNTGKTIVLRLLYAQLANFPLTAAEHIVGKRAICRDEDFFKMHMKRFDKVTNDIITSGASRNVDYNDFSSLLELNNKKILLISHSVKSDEFKTVFKAIQNLRPSVVVFCAKERETNNTVYQELHRFLLSLPDEDYLEIPIQRIKSDQMEAQKTEYATDLFNIIVRLAEGQSLSEIAYHENKKPKFL